MPSRRRRRSPRWTTSPGSRATYLHLGAASVGATFKPAGLDKSKGILSAGFMKDVTDPKWADDADVKTWMAWMKENMPGAELNDSLNEAGYMPTPRRSSRC